jgi:hypothetical protein
MVSQGSRDSNDRFQIFVAGKAVTEHGNRGVDLIVGTINDSR